MDLSDYRAVKRDIGRLLDELRFTGWLAGQERGKPVLFRAGLPTRRYSRWAELWTYLSRPREDQLARQRRAALEAARPIRKPAAPPMARLCTADGRILP